MKVPKARKLPSGNWLIQLRLGGESISITKPTEKEVIRAAELLKAEHRNGKSVEKRRELTLRTAIDEYISRRSNVCSPASIRGWRIIQRNRFQTVMDRPISLIQNWQSVVNSEASLCSAKTLKTSYMFVCSVLRENGITPPSVKLPQIVANPREFLDPDQIRDLLQAIYGHDCEMAALLALHSLRRSELLAIERRNVDLTAGTIQVKGAVVPDEHGNYIKKRTNKNTTSARTIPIMIPRLAELVKAAPAGPLVTTHPECIGRGINRVCEKHSLPLVGIHGLRHSFASLAYHLGLSEKEVMEIGGWADQTTMHKIYTHISQKDRQKAANKMADFYKSLPKNANAI